MCAPGQGGVRILYIAITLLFLLLTVMAEMMVGEEFGGGGGRLLEWRGGGWYGKPGDVVCGVFVLTVD